MYYERTSLKCAQFCSLVAAKSVKDPGPTDTLTVHTEIINASEETGVDGDITLPSFLGQGNNRKDLPTPHYIHPNCKFKDHKKKIKRVFKSSELIVGWF